jgi:PhnB protein
MAVKPIPDGYHTITPYIMAADANQFLSFLQKAFDAEVRHKTLDDEGRVRHAEVRVGTSMVMVSQGVPEYPAAPISIYSYVNDCDAVIKRALAAGATELMPVADHFYGDRNGGVKDPVGNTWYIGTRIEDVPPEEMKRREQEEMKKRKK